MHDDIRTLPLAVSVKECGRLLSLGRTSIYELIGKQDLEAVKRGTRTLLTMTSILAYLAALPRVR